MADNLAIMKGCYCDLITDFTVKRICKRCSSVAMDKRYDFNSDIHSTIQELLRRHTTLARGTSVSRLHITVPDRRAEQRDKTTGGALVYATGQPGEQERAINRKQHVCSGWSSYKK